MVMPHLLRHVGERLARHLLLSGELIGAEEAVRGGLINEIASPNHLLPRALELAKSLAEGGPQALAATKSLLQQFSRQAVSIEEAARASAAPRLTEECRQGLRAFFEKKSPPWSV
jgi:methylglutaconyl-CoA hydratase